MGAFLLTSLAPPGALAEDPPIPDVGDRETPFDLEESVDPTLVREVEPIPIELPSGGDAPAVDSVDASVELRPPGEDTDGAPASRSELADRRAERSRTFAETDGSFTAEYSDARLNFLDASGEWIPVDLSLRAVEGGRYDLEVASLDRQVRFATADAEAAMAVVSSEQGSVAVRAIGYGAASARDDDEGQVRFAGADGSGEVWAAPDDYGFEFGATLADSSQTEVYQFVIDAGDLDVELDRDGHTLLLIDTELREGGAPAAETVVGRISAPLVFDATFAPAPADGISVELTRPGAEETPDEEPATEEPTEAPAATEGPAATEAPSATVAPDATETPAPTEAPDATEIPTQEPSATEAPAATAAPTAEPAATQTPAPTDEPAAEEPPAGDPEDATTRLAPTEVMLTYRIDRAWLDDPGRAYPVTLDPTVCIGYQASGCNFNQTTNGGDTFVASGATPSSGWTVNRTGYDARSDDGGAFGAMRSLWYFPDIVAATWEDGSQIQSATMRLQIGYVAGSPGGKVITAFGINEGWSSSSTWAQVSGAYNPTPSHSKTIPSSPAAGNLLTFTVTDIVRGWYTRRGADWRPNVGVLLKFSTEPSNAGELDFRRWGSTSTSSASPLLTINYNVPKVGFEFDSALGPDYAPSTMVAGQTATLPVRVRNDYDYFYQTDQFRVGYRWFDADGDIVGSDTEALPANLGPGDLSDVIALDVAPPATVGQYTLRIDLVQVINGELWASDWARPSRYFSRNKKVLSSDNTRWTGSSVVERAEFPINVVAGGGTSVGALRSVPTGAGGELAINLWGGNLRYAHDAGVGFDDLIPLGLEYGYDRANIADCGGVLRACGWWTNWDEGITAGVNAGEFTYQAPDGTQHMVSTDPDGHLTSSAPVLIQRQRYTLYDENDPPNAGVTLVTASGAGIPALSGTYVQRSNSNTSTSYGLTAANAIDINNYRMAKFAVRTTAAAGTGIDFKILNLTNPGAYPSGRWLVYTVGTDFSVGFVKEALGGTVLNTWTSYSRDIYQDAISSGFGVTGDRLQVIAMQTTTNGLSGGYTYTDAVRFTGLEGTFINDSNPSWTTGGAHTGASTDAAVGSHSVRVNLTNLANSPRCASSTSCFTTSGHLHTYHFVNWYWKKVGGSSAAMVLELEDTRTGVTDTLTYYAGAVAPPGASNPIQVSDTSPENWTLVERNVWRDAQQVLGFYNDNPAGSGSALPPIQGPTGDRVELLAFRPWAPDGNFVLFDRFQYGSLPVRGSTGALYQDDFLVTSGDGVTSTFNRDGMLESVADRDGNTVLLDYSVSAESSGQGAYYLTAIRAPTDGDASPGNDTYRRYLQVTGEDDAGGFGLVSFIERLGTASAPITGRQADFFVAVSGSSAAAPGNTYAVGDLVAVSPGRNPGTSCSGARPTGCVDFDYVNSSSHSLDEVRDPRWNGATSGSGDLRLTVGYSGSKPYYIADRSQTGAPSLLYVPTYDRGSNSNYRVAVWQDANMRAANRAADLQLSSDGSVMVEYVPKGCSGGGSCSTSSGTWPAAGGSADRMVVNQFNGLSRINQSTRYRTANANPTVTRQATKAAARVDNYADALTASEVTWTQSAEQHFASVRDSANLNPDLYRTFYTYNEGSRPTSTTTWYHNPRPNYAGTVLTSTHFASALKGYWRLGETSGTTAVDLAATPHNGTIASGSTLNQGGALVGDTDKAISFNGSTGRVTSALNLPQAAYTLEAWVRQNSVVTTGSRGIVGDRVDGSGALLFVSEGNQLRFVHGSTAIAPAGVYLVEDRWYHIAATWDGALARVYLDGRLVGSAAVSSSPGSGASSFEIASHGNGGAGTFNNVRIDEVAVWSEALSAAQLANQHLAGRSVAAQTTQTAYDSEWHPTQVSDQLLDSPGFESGAGSWEINGTGGYVFVSTSEGSPYVHSGYASFKTGLSGNIEQHAQLVPGQTFRFQVWERRTGDARARITMYYWDRDAAVWDTFFSLGYENASYTGHAWDVTLPRESDGRVRVLLWTQDAVGSDTVFFDDAAILTSYGRATYNANGTPSESFTFSPASGATAPAEIAVKTTYTATTVHPPIYPSSVKANDTGVAFDPQYPDRNVVTSATYDAWGRALTSTDPDGVTSTNAYAASGNGIHTDLASTSDGLGNTSTYTYDTVGNALTAISPLGLVTATTVDLFGRPLDETAPDGTRTRHVYDGFGRETATIANHDDGTPDSDGSGTDDLTTTRTYDHFGQVLTIEADDGGIEQLTTTAYDLFGNLTAQTVDVGGGVERITTYYFETSQGFSRATPTGVRGPEYPTAAPAPVCPGGGSDRCHSVSALDINGREIRVTNTYGKAAVTWHNLAGEPALAWANYVDGVYSSGAPDTDLLTTTVYDLLGRPQQIIDVAGRVTTAEFDGLGRQTRTIRHDSSFARTVYTPAGRTDRTSRLAASGTSDANLSWTRSEYDGAGRQVRTLDHFDITGYTRSLSDALEGDTDGWSGASTGFFTTAAAVSAGASDPYGATAPRSGRQALHIDANAGSANSGASLDLSSRVFQAGHTYRVTADLFAASGSYQAFLGVDQSGASFGSSSTLTPAGAWTSIDFTWSPGADSSANVRFAVRKTSSGGSFLLDNLQIWDTGAVDDNITTETVYDADGRVIASILPPGAPGEPPLVTTTAYDPAGRAVTVSANALHALAARIASGAGAEGLIAYWPLDEVAGSSLAVSAGSGPTLSLGGGTDLGVAGAVDEARTALSFDSGWADGSSAATSATDDFSLAAWFRLDAATPNQMIAYNGTDAGGWGLGIDGGGQLAAVFGGVGYLSTNQTPSLGAWHHAVLVRDNGITTLYLDGVAYTPASASTAPLTPGAAFNIGRRSAATPRYLDGAVDEVAVYDQPLSSATVDEHYAAGREDSSDARLTTRTDYDPLGRAIRGTTPRGIVTAHEYDRLGRLTATVANLRDGTAASATSDDDVRSEFGYNAVGELLGYCSAVQVFAGGCDPANPAEVQAWRYSYDGQGRMTTQVPPVNLTATALDIRVWTYDAGGRTTSITDRNSGGTVSRHTDTTYDGVGRPLLQRTYAGGGTGNLELEWTTTWNADSTRASRTFDGSAASPAQGTDGLTFTYDSLGRPDLVKRGSTVLTDYAWNADDTLASRDDLSLGSTTFTYDWADRQASVDPPALFGAGTIDFEYRLDGLLAGRSTPNGVDATLAYDAARRPIEVDFDGDTLSRSYDRDNNALTDSRSLSGVSGDAGSGTATYSYDGLNRITAADGLARDDGFAYDRNGNRVTKVEGSTTIDYAYDRADQIIEQTIGGVDTAFAYNAWGDMTSSADAAGDVTGHAYDAGGRLVSLTPPGASASTLAYDALGRPQARTTGAATLTYSYVGTGQVSYATVPSAGDATYALVDGGGSRLGLATGSAVAWSMFDVHGNLAGAQASGSDAVVSALRYDPYGGLLDSYSAGSGSTATPWRFQGRLDLSPDTDEPLYDYGARMYRPSAGTFTQLDTYAGQAQNPLSMNRYLYAHANPATLIDPTGHAGAQPPMIDGTCVPKSCASIPPTKPGQAPEKAAPTVRIPALLDMEATPSVFVGDLFSVHAPSPLLDPEQWSYYPLGGPIRHGFCPSDALYCWAPGNRPDRGWTGDDWSTAVQMITGPGDIYQAISITAKYDWIAGRAMTDQEQRDAAAYFLMSFGLVPTAVARRSGDTTMVVNQAGDVLDMSRVLIPEGKVGYLTQPRAIDDKSGIFTTNLGYSASTYDELETALRTHLAHNWSTVKFSHQMPDGGIVINVSGPMSGPSGAVWDLLTVWAVDLDGTVRLVTARP